MLNYNYYEGLVNLSASTKGLNIHDIANSLGIVLGCVELLTDNPNRDDRATLESALEETTKHLGTLTGVWVDGDSIYMG